VRVLQIDDSVFLCVDMLILRYYFIQIYSALVNELYRYFNVKLHLLLLIDYCLTLSELLRCERTFRLNSLTPNLNLNGQDQWL